MNSEILQNKNQKNALYIIDNKIKIDLNREKKMDK